MIKDLGSQKKNKLHPINYLGLLQLPAWVSNAVKINAVGKWTVRLRRNTSACLSVNDPRTIHMEQVKTQGSALSPMLSRLLPTLGHAWQRNVPL